jgi:hypothetical protein
MSRNIKKAKIVCGLPIQNLKTVAFSCSSSLLCLALSYVMVSGEVM